jgi:hypothetical protein
MNDQQSGPYTSHYGLMPYASSNTKRLEGFQAALNSDAKAL